jgi:NAD(P)H-dependent FMN reductase
MRSLLIVWHSRTGAAEALARAAYDGARGEGSARLLRAEETQPDDMLAAAGYIFAAPENLGSLSGEMKAFFDRSYYPLLGAIEGLAFAQMIAAGSDGKGAARQVSRIATGWRLREVQPAMIVKTFAQTPDEILARKALGKADLRLARDLGTAMMAGLASGIF